MIAGRLLKKQLALLAEDHPTRGKANCVNQGQVKYPCSACKDICPQGVYGGPLGQQEDFAACINCNLCISACPARCIAPSMQNALAYLRLLELPEERVVIAGGEADGKAHLQVPSLAALPWEYLACLGFDKQVVLLMGRQTPQETALLEETLVRLAFFFGQETYQKQFLLTGSAENIPPLLVDRREIFHRMRRGVKRHAAPLVSGPNQVSGLLYRDQLAQRMQKAPQGTHFGFVLPRVNENCTGCTVCALLCPQKAIRIQKDGAGFSVVVDMLRCNGCGLCAKTCIHQAIDGMGAARLESMGPVRLLRKENGIR